MYQHTAPTRPHHAGTQIRPAAEHLDWLTDRQQPGGVRPFAEAPGRRCYPNPKPIVVCDPDQAQELGAQIYYPHRLKILDASGPFALTVSTNHLNSLAIGDVTYSCDVELDCAELRSAYHVNVPLFGAIDSDVGHTAAQATSRVATIYQPTGRTVLRRWYGSSRAITLKIDRAVLDGHLQQLLGRSCAGSVDFSPSMPIDHGLGAGWWAMVRQLDHLLRSNDGATDLARFPLMAHHLEYGVIGGLLLAANHSCREELQGCKSLLRPRTVKLVIDAIEQYPDRPFTAADLAGLAGCSVRRLQESFQEHIGTTPMAYLRDVRLDRVRRALLAADPALNSVAEIAHTWGFSNLGRFSMAYRQKFGASPSTTLRS
jgi:AraC-like DNA-binding protein